jgi:transcriptional regulator of acetoin/glycerol metabolism
MASSPSTTRAVNRPASVRAVLTDTAPAATFEDPRLLTQFDTARRVIARRTPVLLCGETGSGKEVFARALHDASPNAAGAFVAINCASLPETLIESELFGYRAGAFTGAQRTGRRGKILQADGGTLFLDEIADMPFELQARLLRVLDERRVTPLGTEETHSVDFQLVSASHEHLPARVREGRFREDLYYRLAGIEVQLPALRDRSDRREVIRDVLALEGGSEATLSPEAERLLMEHPWPGNIRQLGHVLRTASALCNGKTITREHLPSMNVNLQPSHPRQMHASTTSYAGSSNGAPTVAMANGNASHASGADQMGGAPSADGATVDDACPVKLNPIQANERQVLLQMLEQHRWNVSNVARALDVSRNTLYRKLYKLHIQISHPEPSW